jgi:ribonuclease III
MDLPYKFIDDSLRVIALTHPSMSKNAGVKSYERLEFLGDKVISMMISRELFTRFPEATEGEMSRRHSNLVRTHTLAEIARVLKLGEAMILDKGEETNGGRDNPRNLEDVLEAMVGAIYIDSSYDSELIKSLFLPLWESYLGNPVLSLRDSKSLLQEWSQKSKHGIPEYKLISEEGLAHSKLFTVELQIESFQPIKATASSIKKAEAEAAKIFIQKYRINESR